MKMKRIILPLMLLFVCSVALAQKTDKKLQKEIEAMISGFHGDIGVYVKDLKKNRIVAINADTIFPTASMVKIPILIGIMDKMNKGELEDHQELVYSDSMLYPGVDILGTFKDGEKIELSKVMMLMLTMSDNTASLWLQKLAGTGTRINEILDSLGFANTRVNSRTEGRRVNWEQYGWGQTTPRELATLMEEISKGEIISKEKSAVMLRRLGRNYWDQEAVSQIPPDVFVASKNGAVNESRGEVMFVNGEKARYVFCVCTKNIKDQSWKDDNEAWELTRRLSKKVWERYH